MENEEKRERKKPGPVPGPPMKMYPVRLTEEVGEWAKRRPGGLSALVRRLLEEAMAKEEGNG